MVQVCCAAEGWRVVEFAVGDVVRQGFGFANPNHAAAAICAAFPFCWGWGGSRALTFTRLQGRKFDIIGVYPGISKNEK